MNFRKLEGESASNGQNKYGPNDVRQQELTDAVVDLIIESMLPQQLVESPRFLKFMPCVDPKYVVGAKTIQCRVGNCHDLI